MKSIACLALFAAAACSKPAADCDAAIHKAMDSAAAQLGDPSNSPAIRQAMMAVVAELRPALSNRCKVDHWSPAAIACVAAITKFDGMEACQVKLTSDQRAKLDAAMSVIRRHLMESRMPTGAAGPPGAGGVPAGPTGASGTGSGESTAATAAAPATPPAREASPQGAAAPAGPGSGARSNDH